MSQWCNHASLTDGRRAGPYHKNPDSDSSLECDNGQPRSPILVLGGKFEALCPPYIYVIMLVRGMTSRLAVQGARCSYPNYMIYFPIPSTCLDFGGFRLCCGSTRPKSTNLVIFSSSRSLGSTCRLLSYISCTSHAACILVKM